MEFNKRELLYLHNCTGAHKFEVRARDPYSDELESIYYSVRQKLDAKLKELETN